MILILGILIILSLFGIAIQDFRERKVYWILFPIVFCLGFYFRSLDAQLTDVILDTAINSAFVSLIMIICGVYFKYLKKKELKHIIGIGDIFMFLSLTSMFNSLDFLVYFNLSLFLSLLISIPFLFYNRKFQIPLAGLQSIGISMIVILSINDIQISNLILDSTM